MRLSVVREGRFTGYETPLKISKKDFLCLGKGKLLGDFGDMNFTKKKVISDQSRCYIPFEYKPLSFLHKSSFLPKNLIFDRSVTRSEIVF